MPQLKDIKRLVWDAHPLKFLLGLEWVLLLCTFAIELPLIQLVAIPRHPSVLWVGLIGFAILGLALPQIRNRQLGHRQFYTVLELILVLTISWVGGARLFSLLWVIVVMRNCLILEGQYCNWVTLLAFGLSWITWSYRLQVYFGPMTGLSPSLLRVILASVTLLSGLVMLFLHLLVTAILAERQSQEKLAAVNQQLRQYALQVEELAIVQERNRIAREIHDALGHSLMVFNLHLNAALQLWQADPQEARELLIEARQVAAKTLQEVRQSVSSLRSDPLAEQTLQGAVAGLCEEFQRATGIQPQFNLHLQTQAELPLATKVAFYRIIQEALTNICKYAHASQVEICLEQHDRELLFYVRDNGQGFDPRTNTTGFGLQGMKERSLGLGGSLQLLTSPGQGCEIRVIFPFRDSSYDSDFTGG
jgi:signal transduction histidine kinase